jgi:hypothetical protein
MTVSFVIRIHSSTGSIPAAAAREGAAISAARHKHAAIRDLTLWPCSRDNWHMRTSCNVTRRRLAPSPGTACWHWAM